ncbi:MAG: hypothetical protein ACI9Y7_001847 [Dokdonia sp.]|jgi:hypothetical protein
MKTRIKQLVLIMLFWLPFAAVAQKAETPDYRYDVGAKINDMTIAISGNMIVATNDGLVGIKPGSNELLFNFTEYGRVKLEEITYVPASPYLIVAQNGLAGISSKKAVIDHVTGEVIFSTEKNGWKTVWGAEIKMPQNKLVVNGFRKGGGKAESMTARVAVYDLATGKEDYSFFLVKPGKVTMKSFSVSGQTLLLNDKLIVPTSQGMICKSKSGETLWENKTKNIQWMTAGDNEKDIYGFITNDSKSNTKIFKIGGDGSELWADNAKVQGVVSNFQILPQGLAVVSDKDTAGKSILAGRSESKIALLSATNGEDLWDKAPKTKGFVQHFYVMDDGILFGVYSGGINKVSFDGKPLFKKPLKIGENILTMAETDNGLIYITSEDANIVNLNTGDQVWKKPLKYKKASAVSSTYDATNNRYLISADDELLAIDATTNDVTTLAESKFDGKEDPTHVEMRDGGILLTSDQNLSLLEWKGGEQWHSYYKAPGKSLAGKIVAGVTAVASTAAMMSMSFEAGMNKNHLGQYNKRGRDADRAANMFASISSASFAELSKRFKATAATQNSQFILTNLDSGAGLVKINKDSGAMEKQILLKDKKPEYQVDEWAGVLYYKADNNSIFAYDLTK